MAREALVTVVVVRCPPLGYKRVTEPPPIRGLLPILHSGRLERVGCKAGRWGVLRPLCATLASIMTDHPSTAPAGDEPAGPARGRGARPRAVAWVAAALGVEALVLVSLAVVGVLDVLDGDATAVAPALALVVAALLVAWLLAACGRGLLSGVGWVRGPAITLQLLALLVALSLAQGGLRALPAVIACLAGATFVGLVLPAVTAYTRRETLPFVDED